MKKTLLSLLFGTICFQTDFAASQTLSWNPAYKNMIDNPEFEEAICSGGRKCKVAWARTPKLWMLNNSHTSYVWKQKSSWDDSRALKVNVPGYTSTTLFNHGSGGPPQGVQYYRSPDIRKVNAMLPYRLMFDSSCRVTVTIKVVGWKKDPAYYPNQKTTTKIIGYVQAQHPDDKTWYLDQAVNFTFDPTTTWARLKFVISNPSSIDASCAFDNMEYGKL